MKISEDEDCNLKKKNIKNLIINKNTVRLLLGSSIMVSTITLCKDYKNYKPEKLSTGITSSLIKQNNYNYEKIVKIDSEKQVNLMYNKKNFSKIKELNITVCDTNIEDLKKFPNLEKLTLKDVELLTDNDKKTINSLENLKIIDLCLNGHNFNENIDISWISNKKIEITKEYNITNDLSDLIAFHKSKELIEENPNLTVKYFSPDRLNELINWDQKIDNLVKSFEFYEHTTDEKKLVVLTNYATDSVEYDPDIIDAPQAKADQQYDRIFYLNNNLLKDYFDGKEYGICCNYGALLKILSVYSELDLDYIEGVYGITPENSQGHVWCKYKDNIVDPTQLDYSIAYNNTKAKYNSIDKSNDFILNTVQQDEISIIEILPSDLAYTNYTEDAVYKAHKNIEYENEYANYYNTIVDNDIKKHELLILASLLLLKTTFTKKKERKLGKKVIKNKTKKLEYNINI